MPAHQQAEGWELVRPAQVVLSLFSPSLAWAGEKYLRLAGCSMGQVLAECATNWHTKHFWSRQHNLLV